MSTEYDGLLISQADLVDQLNKRNTVQFITKDLLKAVPGSTKLDEVLISVTGGLCHDHCFYTGSRVWGVHKKDSDFDLCVRQSVLGKVFVEYYGDAIKLGDYNNVGNHVRIEGCDVNLIFLTDSEFETWRLATSVLDTIVKITDTHAIQDRSVRVFVFQSLRNLISYMFRLSK